VSGTQSPWFKKQHVGTYLWASFFEQIFLGIAFVEHGILYVSYRVRCILVESFDTFSDQELQPFGQDSRQTKRRKTIINDTTQFHPFQHLSLQKVISIWTKLFQNGVDGRFGSRDKVILVIAIRNKALPLRTLGIPSFGRKEYLIVRVRQVGKALQILGHEI